MNIKKSKSTLVAVAFLGNLLMALLAPSAQATLVGDTISASGTSLGPPSATIGAESGIYWHYKFSPVRL